MAEALTLPIASERKDASAGDAASPDGPCSTTLVVENMVCGGCMRKVENALAGLADVTAVRANLSAKRVTVFSDRQGINPQDLIGALDAIGFKAAELPHDAAEEASSLEKDLLRRVAIAGFAAANIMLLSVSVWSGGAGDMGETVRLLFHWLSAAIALPTVAYAGQPFFRSAASALAAWRLNMDVPISLGVLLATGMSVFQVSQGSDQVYFDAAVTLLFFLLLGRFLDTRMRVRAQGAAANLLGLRSVSAKLIKDDGSIEDCAARDLIAGMHILVSPGERIAVDGQIVEGRSEIDESIITGESVPRGVERGGGVYAGSVNLGDQLIVRAEATDNNTLLAEIARLMTAAEQGRGRYVRLADRAAAFYAPAVHILGFATFVTWLALGAGWQAALTAGIAVLIVTCPCALALAVPAVQVAASGRLFDRGIIIKAADGLERIAEVDTVVFDKTGTLTLPKLQLSEIINGTDDDLAMASSLAVSSNHPYAQAVVAAARQRGLEFERVANVEEFSGRGLVCESNKGEVRLGSSQWCGISNPEHVAQAALWLCRSGGFVFEEALRPDAKAVIDRLRARGIHTEILSGDRVTAVQAIADQLGVKDWHGRQSPKDKIERIEALRQAGCTVLMVGDGLNDAPALTAATASISPATAADISQTTSDAIFQGEQLAGVLETIAVARVSRQMAIQNFLIAIAYNMIFVPLAMAGLVTPLLAAIAMSASSIAVTANALRLRTRSLEI